MVAFTIVASASASVYDKPGLLCIILHYLHIHLALFPQNLLSTTIPLTGAVSDAFKLYSSKQCVSKILRQHLDYGSLNDVHDSNFKCHVRYALFGLSVLISTVNGTLTVTHRTATGSARARPVDNAIAPTFAPNFLTEYESVSWTPSITPYETSPFRIDTDDKSVYPRGSRNTNRSSVSLRIAVFRRFVWIARTVWNAVGSCRVAAAVERCFRSIEKTYGIRRWLGDENREQCRPPVNLRLKPKVGKRLFFKINYRCWCPLRVQVIVYGLQLGSTGPGSSVLRQSGLSDCVMPPWL